MWDTIFLLIAALIVMAGVILVYDARSITTRMFGFGDQNEAALGLKIAGFIVSVIGAIIIYFNL